MSIYIDDGKKVTHYCTDKKTDKAVATLLEQIEDIVTGATREGYCVTVVERED